MVQGAQRNSLTLALSRTAGEGTNSVRQIITKDMVYGGE